MAQNTIQQGSGLSGLQFRTNNNAALLTLQTNFSGNSAPSNPETYQYWIDTSTTPPTIKQYYNNAWLSVGQVTTDWGLAKKANPSFSGLASFSGNASFTGAGYVKLPAGNNTTDRPTSPSVGMLRYNTTTNKFEGYQTFNGTAQWADVTVGQTILDNAVTTSKIADGSVTQNKLSAELRAGRVRGRKLIGRQYNVYTNNQTGNSYSYKSIFGRGNCYDYFNPLNAGGFISQEGKVYFWGQPAETTYCNFGFNGGGNHITEPIQAHMRHPKWLWHAQLGEATHQNAMNRVLPLSANSILDTSFTAPSGVWYSWSDNVNGVSNYTQYSRNTPEVCDVVHAAQRTYFLTENGMSFVCGHKYSNPTPTMLGNGRNPNASELIEVPTYISYYDDAATPNRHTGNAIPQIIQITDTSANSHGATESNSWGGHTSQYFTTYALSSLGVVYSWGNNSQGQLGDGTNSNSSYASYINPIEFNNETIKYIHAGGSGANSGYCFAITASGKLYAWGDNTNGQLGLQDTNNRNSPVEVTGQTGNNLLNKKVLHVITHGSDGYEHTFILTDEGKVYACGKSEGYGAYTGVYSTTADRNITNPALLSNHPSGTNEKVVSLWSYGSRYTTTFLITASSQTNNIIRAYSFGNNAKGQLGRGASLTNTHSASVQGDWLAAEIEFTDLGDTYLQHSSGTYPSGEVSNALEGTFTGGQWPSDFAVSSAGYRFPGRPVAFFANPAYNDTQYEVVCLDDKGQLWHCGSSGNEVMSQGVEYDSDHLGEDADTYLDRFTPFLQQPERAIEMQFTTTGNNQSGYLMLGESGTVYAWGTNTNKALARDVSTAAQIPPSPIALTTD